MLHLELLELLAIGFAAAFVLGLFTSWLRLSPIVGYLLAGILVGPHSPGYVANRELAHQLAEVGVTLLMFGVGLHFDLRDLLAVRRIAVPGAILQTIVATILGAVVAWAFEMTLTTGLVLGLGIAVARTRRLVRALTDHNILDTTEGHIAVGWLIVEDILTVLILVILPTLASSFGSSGDGAADGNTSILASLGLAVVKLTVLGLLILVVGGKVVPWVLTFAARSRSRELFTLSILVIAFAVATAASVVFGASTALGAFLAGMVVGRSNVSHQAASDVLPMRDAFAVLFFVSVGMLFDPQFIVAHPGLVISTLAVILLAKPIAAIFVVTAMGYTVRTALTAGFGLAQIGEFSFILAQEAQARGMLSKEGNSLLVVCSLISIAVNPVLFAGMNPFERWLRRRTGLWSILNRQSQKRAAAINENAGALLHDRKSRGHAIVVGYGPVGQTLARILREAGHSIVIIDLNVDTVMNLSAQGQAAVYGDGAGREILGAAGIAEAQHLLLTLPDMNTSLAIITTARAMNADIKILVRARYMGAQPMLEGLGVQSIAFEEEEVAKAMAEQLAREVETPGTAASTADGN